jgi:hypothetical protein
MTLRELFGQRGVDIDVMLDTAIEGNSLAHRRKHGRPAVYVSAFQTTDALEVTLLIPLFDGKARS